MIWCFTSFVGVVKEASSSVNAFGDRHSEGTRLVWEGFGQGASGWGVHRSGFIGYVFGSGFGGCELILVSGGKIFSDFHVVGSFLA